ncbi:uncharacterized protein MYCGRDRAFT_24569, partial [Zymoseptoria tritici IPO323]
CRQLPGADDVLVVMKTGASEVESKLAVHLRTTLTCYPNHVIFADVEEDLPSGEHLYDAFQYTTPSLRETHSEFALWRKLHAEGRAGLLPSELSGPESRQRLEDVRKKIPGWQLDKWKFLPMANQTIHMYPDKRWYVFVEADTYLLWSSLLVDLAARPWTDDLYVGSEVIIEDLAFAHGGSGFLLSRSALEKFAKTFNSDQSHWESVNEKLWVGDHIFAVALQEAGVHLQNGFPTWQGDPLSFLDLRPDGGLWCSTAVTSHHQTPAEIEDIWNLEQTIISGRAKGRTKRESQVLRHRDIFEQYVLPRIQESRTAWNNQPTVAGREDRSETVEVSSLLECEGMCERDKTCLQFAVHDNKECKTTSKVVLGEEAEGFESGWMLGRI